MILTKEQIKKLKKANSKAMKAENALSSALQGVAMLIEDFTEIEGECSFLAGDGVGFNPNSERNTHIPIDSLIKEAEKGVDINRDYILENLSI
ncbi:hypothetical protein N4T42_02215 [Riemerella anatipestifer]|uniref:hypothetical protein n=1 Tax=Riemerella anatipestifer TaxID=34085 RepID=UPI0021D60708|nr:hypothetical protein [Riemerella anatipestifer]MCU7559117.1 hypothetical protein [Riemerella anatipestifer]MDY3400689.1 hypothetical protein [Riemerella anatipestifer]